MTLKDFLILDVEAYYFNLTQKEINPKVALFITWILIAYVRFKMLLGFKDPRTTPETSEDIRRLSGLLNYRLKKNRVKSDPVPKPADNAPLSEHLFYQFDVLRADCDFLSEKMHYLRSIDLSKSDEYRECESKQAENMHEMMAINNRISAVLTVEEGTVDKIIGNALKD